MAGYNLETAYVSIGGAHIHSQNSHGVVAVSDPNGEITESDVDRAIEAASAISLPVSREVIFVVPREFIVDGESGVRDAVGMSGVRLEVETQIIQGMGTHLKNLTKCIYRTGVDIEDAVLSILAASEAVCTPHQKELGVAVVNIGRSSTEVAVFEGGDLIHIGFLPIGGEFITSDIAIGLRTSLEAAEKIKLEYGSALPEGVGKREEIDVGELEGKESNFVSKKYIAEITEARVEEIFSKINNELKKIDRSGKLPAGAVLVGGGAKLNGLVEAAKKQLRLPASLGKPLAVTSAIDKVSDPAFATAIGLVIWGSQVSRQGGGGNLGKILSRLPSLKGVAGQAKKMLGKFLGRR